MALIPLAFFITAVVRTAQGSATVALITASGILADMAQNANLGFNPVYLCLAIGSGAKLIPWMNDAGFWIMCKTSNLTEQEALKNHCTHADNHGHYWFDFDYDCSSGFSDGMSTPSV